MEGNDLERRLALNRTYLSPDISRYEQKESEVLAVNRYG
jgi:hypothetical protein